MDEKVISEILESKYDGKDLARYLAFSLALRDFYQSLHWGTFGDSFYEDHLLYERLYNEISESGGLFMCFDMLAEDISGRRRR